MRSAEAGMGAVERLEHLTDRRALDRHLTGASGQGPQLGGDPDGDAHRASPATARSADGLELAADGLGERFEGRGDGGGRSDRLRTGPPRSSGRGR